ncbi:hypothetical protein RISK_001220 [Rhodopirellula islandica]|uniref:Uncharacterized protein n=1 Tax=Rhodopirellula islandica TaxID=595434 RepID=A0A0J1BJK1_RHOIS|nr:hypothetical protein RISK_001220 [Rhodopirellula islandica]
MVLGRCTLVSRRHFDDASLCSKASAWVPCETWTTGVNRILGESGYELTWLL